MTMYAIVRTPASGHPVDCVLIVEDYETAIERAVLLAADSGIFDRWDGEAEAWAESTLRRSCGDCSNREWRVKVIRAFRAYPTTPAVPPRR
jgi:hypothetical protein